MKYETHLTTKSSQTKRLGEKLAQKILRVQLTPGLDWPGVKRERAVIIGLVGDLGGGKTTFLQGFAKGLGIKQKILSPTFVIMRRFQISSLSRPSAEAVSGAGKFQDFYHIDCYRIQNPKDILSLGFKEIISDPQNIVAIEWADRVRKIVPKGTIWINFEFVDKNIRKILLKFT